MKRFEVILIQIFAVIGSYLIVSMPFAFGFEVSIFTSDMQEFTTSITDFTQLINKGFSYPYRMNVQYISITLSSKDPGKTIKKVYLYRCKDYNPVECLQNGILPVISVSPFNATIWFNDETRWNDVQRNDVANFLTLVKMDIGGNEIWTGSWDIIEETGVGQFTPRNYDLDKLNVYLKPGVQGGTVKSYIESYLNVPTNWVDHSVLTLVEGSSVSKLHELTGNNDDVDPPGTGTPSFYVGVLTGNSFNGSSKDWTFIFGGNGKVSNPVVFYSTGDGVTPIVSGASLKIDNWSPQTVTCGSSNVITVTSHVENASALDCGEADCYFQDYYYTIDGVQSSPGSINCSITNPVESIYKYQCSIPVDKFPACSAPKTSTIKLYFEYKNSISLSAEFPITLQQPPASLIVNSLIPSIFDCGIDTELTANLKVTNPPGGTPGKFYTFDGTSFNSMSCTGSGGTFVCKIPESEICSLLQEDLDVTFKFEYPEVDITSDSVNLQVTFPPPSLGVDTVTPEVFTAGQKTSAEVLLHVNYPDSITYSETDFKYKYLDNPFQSASCSLDNSFTNIKYYKCSIELDIPSGKEGVEQLNLRLDAYQGGQLKSLLANYFITITSPPPQPSLTIVSTSSPLDCLKDTSLTVQAKAENIQGSPTSTEYSVDGGSTFESLTCSSSGSVYTCYIPKENLCPLLTNSLDLVLKFTYSTTSLVSNSQKIYITIPEPHMQVYSVFPDVLPVGKTSTATVNLYIQYPETVGSPKFVYSYLDKADQSMSCQKVSSTSIRDYYRCSSTSFTIPADYSGDQMSVVFAVEGTTLTYPYNIKITTEVVGIDPWFEIYSTNPGKIEIEPGNSTQATLSIAVHNAAENSLKHAATLQPTSWVTSGTCQETNIDYDFSCDVTFSASKDAPIGENKVDVKIRVSDGKTYILTNQTKVHVLPGKFNLDIQSITPDKLYCQGHKQPNPQQIKINAKVMNLQGESLLQEKILFDGYEIVHADRYCTLQGSSVTCNIPTDKILEKVTCGQGDLAPGEGTHYYTLSLSVLLKSGEQQIQVGGSKDMGIEALPLQAYLEIVDSDIEQGYLREYVNCLGSKTIKLGDGGDYIRIRYADLLHQTPDEKDLTWSFRLDAYDDRGKLTKGMGVSPTANATICKMKRYQQVGVHRYEDYQCTLFVDRKMFQRCAAGQGTITLTAMSNTMGRSAEGEVKVYISRGEEDFDLYVQVEKDATEEINCWITTFDGRCHLEYSQLNSTISIKNRATGDIGGLKLFDADIQLKGGDIETDVYSPYCRETAQGSRRYVCGFGIRPAITIEEEVTNETNQTFRDVDLGDLEFTTIVKFADDLAEDSLKANIGTITVKPKKDPAFIDYLEQKEKIKGVVKTIKDIMKIVLTIAGFCVTCAAGTYIYRGATENKTKTSPYEPGDYLPETGGIKFAERPTCPRNCVDNPDQCPPYSGTYPAEAGEYTCPDNPAMSDKLICCVSGSPKWDEAEASCKKHGGECIYSLNCQDIGDEVIKPTKCENYAAYEGGPKSYVCCKKGAAGTTGGDPVGGPLGDAQTRLRECRDWKCAVPVLLIILGLFVLFKIFIGKKLADQGEYAKALERGLTYGFICVVLQVFGGVLGEGKGKHALTKAGDFLYQACVFLGKNFPALISVLSIVIRWISFQMCIEDIERSLDQGYYGGTGAGAQAYQSGLVGTQSALSRLQGCMNQFTEITKDAWMIVQSMTYSGTGMWGTASLSLTNLRTGAPIREGSTICKSDQIHFEVKNWCKAIMDSGSDAAYLSITSSTGNQCTRVSLYSPERCQAYYGYGYGTGWGSGWGTGGYRPLYEAPGKNSGEFFPKRQCNEEPTNTVTYTLLNPKMTVKITYNPNC